MGELLPTHLEQIWMQKASGSSRLRCVLSLRLVQNSSTQKLGCVQVPTCQIAAASPTVLACLQLQLAQREKAQSLSFQVAPAPGPSRGLTDPKVGSDGFGEEECAVFSSRVGYLP